MTVRARSAGDRLDLGQIEPAASCRQPDPRAGEPRRGAGFAARAATATRVTAQRTSALRRATAEGAEGYAGRRWRSRRRAWPLSAGALSPRPASGRPRRRRPGDPRARRDARACRPAGAKCSARRVERPRPLAVDDVVGSPRRPAPAKRSREVALRRPPVVERGVLDREVERLDAVLGEAGASRSLDDRRGRAQANGPGCAGSGGSTRPRSTSTPARTARPRVVSGPARRRGRRAAPGRSTRRVSRSAASGSTMSM